jgi:FdhD protein
MSLEPPHEAELSVRPVARRVWQRGHGFSESTDLLATEEPLELRVHGAPVAVVMRTPGHDLELGVGFAVTERLVAEVSALERVAHCSTGEHGDNVLLLTLAADAQWDLSAVQRRLYATSSCGLCGKQSIERALAEAPPVQRSWALEAAVLAGLPAQLAQAQPVFRLTGGLHGAALFDRGGRVLVVREDVGRHNAVDKCVGWALRSEAVALEDVGLFVSGRVSYEVVQKALAARIPLVAGVGAVSSLAADLAERARVTLVGFTSADRFAVYAGAEWIQ